VGVWRISSQLKWCKSCSYWLRSESYQKSTAVVLWTTLYKMVCKHSS